MTVVRILFSEGDFKLTPGNSADRVNVMQENPLLLRIFPQAARSRAQIGCVFLVLLFFLFNNLACGADETTMKVNGPRGGCPDFVDIIKNLEPVVVSIAIERHMLQNSSAEQRPLFRSRPTYLDDRVRTKDKYDTDSLGSGFFCDSSGHIVTNAHVVEGASKILVTLQSGKVEPAKVIAVHPKVDLALLKINPPYPLQKAKIGDASTVQVGEWVLAVGNPFGFGRSVTFGIVSGKGRFLGLGPDDNFIQTDAAINPGNSGGPLFNMAGEVIGINTAIISSGKGIGFSIPANYVQELLKSPSNMDASYRGWLGIYVEDMTADQAKRLGFAAAKGTYVDEVLNSTPASSAGLKKGDLILECDGKSVRNGRHLSKLVAGSKPGDILKMRVVRGKLAQTIDVIIGKSPE
jgi:S1-C subfamily serine protease